MKIISELLFLLQLRRMDSELEEELKEREATVAELAQAERSLHELKDKIAELNREKEDKDREMDKIQVIVMTPTFCQAG